MARQIDESGNLSMYISAEKTKFYMVKEMGENTHMHICMLLPLQSVNSIQ